MLLQPARDARLLFVQLWTIADDSGQARAASRLLASLLYPFDEDAPNLVETWLDELAQQGLIVRYVVDGTSYLEITNWLKHQKIDRPTTSKIPPYTAATEVIPSIPRDPSRSHDEPTTSPRRALDDGSWTRSRRGKKDSVLFDSSLRSESQSPGATSAPIQLSLIEGGKPPEPAAN